MRAAARPLLPPLRIGAAVAAALGARLLVAGEDGAAASVPAAAVFALLLGCVAAAGIARPRMSAAAVLRGALIGVGGGASLVLVAMLLRGSPVQVWPRPGGVAALWWTLLVVCVSVAEEMVFRGVLFDAVARGGGVMLACVVCASAFALVHVPLYGWGALPLDVAAGVWLGGLRVLSGGVVAPAVAHALADCGAWLVL